MDLHVMALVCSFTSLKHQRPESGGWGKVQRHQTSSRSAEYQVGVALSCLKVATLLPQLEPPAVAVTQALSVGPA